MKPTREAPQFPIAPVLEALGFEDVPRVTYGHAKVRCAFHGDRTPSASVSQYGFACFSCDRTGDAIKLIREEEGRTYADAVRRCEELTGITDAGISRSTGWGGELPLT